MIPTLVETEDLKYAKWNDLALRGESWFYHDEESDTFMLLVVPPHVETVVHYFDEHLAVLYEPGSLQVVGLQIEAFSEVAKDWFKAEIKRRGRVGAMT